MAGSEQQLRAEQGVVDDLYARLDALRSQARERLAEVRRHGPSGSPQNRSERDAFATLYEDRIAQLDAVEERLCFGRLDLDAGARRYIGRIGLTDDAHTSILTDWRAPAAQPFYQATSAAPGGVKRRRHLVTRGRRVVGVEDEVLDLDDAAALEGVQAGLSGEGALLAALAARRTGRMGDIVATIQAEQDAIIRSELRGALVVQGGPGTGKTAVALHRAAYLLYAHRRQLERSGVLIVGPNRTFLRYIDQVLPSLGETGVVSATLPELYGAVRVDGTDSPLAVRVKGRAAMAGVLARAVRQRQRVPGDAQVFRLDGVDLTLAPRDIADARAKARRTGKPHNLARVTFVREMLGRLAAQYGRQLGHPLAPEDRAVVLEDLRSHRDVRVALNLAWMPLTPEGLLADLYAKPARLAAAAPRLADEELAALRRDKDSGWTEADIPLLDELAELLGEDDQAARAQERAEAERRASDLEYARQVLRGVGGGIVSPELLAERFSEAGPRLTTAERAAADRAWTYGHVVVDEAQELSAMGWRMLLRRCPSRSMTIVGDVAQTASPAGARAWATTLDPLLRDVWRQAELTVNYRTPAEVATAAEGVAKAARLPTSPLVSARDVPGALVVTGGSGDLVDAVVEQVRAGLRDLGAADRDGDDAAGAADGSAGRLAVVAPAGRTGALAAALVDAGLAQDPGGTRAAVDARVSVLDPRASKGLEFDVVVLVEPAELLESGAGDLYVAMTRPTQRLRVVHGRPLPDGFGV